MLVSVWTPKGGSGASVFAAACGLVLARREPARLADFCGDQPAVLGLAADPDAGLASWLAAGPETPADALDRLSVDAAPNLALLPMGHGPVARAAPEAGAALGVVLRDDSRPTIADLGRASAPALQAVREVSDASVLVIRGCYLALRRAVRNEATSRAAGAVLLEESGRALGEREVADVLGVPVLAVVPCRVATSRVVDAGVLAARLPDALREPATRVLERLGAIGRKGAAA